MARDKNNNCFSRSGRALTAIGVLALTSILGWTVWTLPPYSNRMLELVSSNLPVSGVENPVTAVLLNFRGYDTLLEIGVLMLAAVGVLSVGPAPVLPTGSTPSPILILLLRLLLPLITLVGGYLLWVGKSAPGGAFQAGAVLAAGGILYTTVAVRFNPSASNAMPLAMGIGFLVFILVALATMMVRGNFLQYPLPLAGTLILVIEAVATISIATILTQLFIGGEGTEGASAQKRNRRSFHIEEDHTVK